MVSLIIASYFQVILAQSLLQLFLSFTDFNLAPIAGCYGFWELKTETCFLPEKVRPNTQLQNAQDYAEDKTGPCDDSFHIKSDRNQW